ncbi:MAG TPA: L-threonylcarbamoyladenylate synthase [Pyrinomonadaceae bacterium]|jgi:L-threonylcarbamoyladenylate synthase|nr:L-threonylcarbamoyladenylate synthase [Pyrinomonadaceae bacterium]
MILAHDPSALAKAAEIISRGGIIAFRTDTFYGLGTDPWNSNAVRALNELKGREAGKPILVLISDLTELNRFIPNRSSQFDAVAAQFWPGAITLVGKAQPELSQELTAGTNTVGVRLPNDEQVRQLIRTCGGALTGTSANLSENPPGRSAIEVQAQFPEGVDLIIDDGEVGSTEPSTVLDLSGPEARLIREGVIKRDSLRLVVKL